MSRKSKEPTSCVPIAKKRVFAFVKRTGRQTFSFADVNVKPGTMVKLVGGGFIVRSTTEKHKRSIRTIYLLSEREKLRLEGIK